MKHTIKLIATVTASLALTQASYAAIIDVTNIQPDDNPGTYGDFTATLVVSGNTATYTFTNGGLTDLDGGGTNDTLSFDMVYEYYTGGSFDAGTGDVTLGTAAVPNTANANWGTSNFGGGDTLSLGISNLVYTDGEMDAETAVFNGFTALRHIDRGSGAQDVAVGGLTAATIVTTPAANADIDISSLGSNPQLYLTSQDTNGDFRLRNVALQLEIIPEPSSSALLGLGGLALVLRRRK